MTSIICLAQTKIIVTTWFYIFILYLQPFEIGKSGNKYGSDVLSLCLQKLSPLTGRLNFELTT